MPPNYAAARAALAKCHRIDEAKTIRDKAEALRVYAKQAGDFEMQNWAAEIRIRAERRAGELLRETGENGQRRKPGERGKSGHAKGPLLNDETKAPRLADLGITKNQSQEWQKLASLPVKKFDKLVATVKEKTGEVTTGALLREHQAETQAQHKQSQVAAIERAALEGPTGKFDVIIADPPWPYEHRTEDVTHRGAPPYPSMPIDSIIVYFRERIAPVAEESAILWLWTTNAFMVQAHHVAASIGFEVKTILTWAKDRMGVGQWLRGQTEHCLMAVRGRPVVTLTNQSTLLQGKVREHSRKPDEFFALVHSLCPGRVCEFFAREQRPGIIAIGAEKEMFHARCR